MITQGIDAGTGETVGLDAAGTKARSAQADAPKSLNSPTITTQGEALEARARELYEIARPCFHYAKPKTGDGVMFDQSERGTLLMKAMRAIAAALQPNIDHAVGGVDRETLIRAMYEAWPHTVTSQALNELTGLPYGATIRYDMAQRCGASFVALERYADGILALSAPQQPVKLDAVREDDWTAGREDADGNELITVRKDEWDRLSGIPKDGPPYASDNWDVQGYKSPAEEIDDMANVGRSLIEAIASLRSSSERWKHWAPVDCPAEIVFDLANALDEVAALATPPLDNTGLDAATVERLAQELDKSPSAIRVALAKLQERGLVALASGDRS